MPQLPGDMAKLEEYVTKNNLMHKLKKDNEARIVWYNDVLKSKTEYAVVYLHGFSASQAEGEPVHRNFAKVFGCNLYLSRLAEQGIDTVDAMLNFTAEKLWESAKEAYAIGKQLGNKVIIMGTSTGASLALMLAAQNPDVSALILLSPNIAINDPNAWILNNPWGLQIARAVKGSKYIIPRDTTNAYKQYWASPYRLEAAVELEALIESGMDKKTFSQIRQPVLMLYYYKDEKHQDDVVKVSAMKEMFAQLGTQARLKRSVAVPGAGDHVIGSYLKSKDIASVQLSIERFAKEILGMKVPIMSE
jgi:pimeloyl-ACP methyl ester carboxylesterase